MAGHSLADVLEAMTELAIAGDLTCPPIVLRECRKFGEDEPVTRWLRATSGHFKASDDPWEYLEQVLASCPMLIDPDELGESPQTTVLAMALFQGESRTDVVIVTDQWQDLPTRQALGNAASALSVRAISVENFLGEIGF